LPCSEDEDEDVDEDVHDYNYEDGYAHAHVQEYVSVFALCFSRSGVRVQNSLGARADPGRRH